MASIKNSYETIMVFNVQQGEESIKALYERFKALIAGNGEITEEEDWGKRRLAYPIEDELEGYYYLVRFTADAGLPAELDRVYKITEGVLRTLIVRYDPASTAKKKTANAPIAEAPAGPPEEGTAEPAAEVSDEAPAQAAEEAPDEALSENPPAASEEAPDEAPADTSTTAE
ncbi:MAG: 30S ribosomal protein S6 [Oscillospiraceae bacterium]|nr:30S ribosomal protein S6 [Oscillospiraceae bacterium]